MVTPRLTTLLLCDFAQVREGLLFVSSGGVSRVVQSNYPANPRLHLAMVVHLPAASLGSHTRSTCASSIRIPPRSSPTPKS